MFRQKQIPRGNNPPQKSCIYNSIEITFHTGSPLQIRCTLTKHAPRGRSPEGCFCIDIQLVKILKLDFVKRNLLKVKTHETIVLIDCDH